MLLPDYSKEPPLTPERERRLKAVLRRLSDGLRLGEKLEPGSAAMVDLLRDVADKDDGSHRRPDAGDLA